MKRTFFLLFTLIAFPLLASTQTKAEIEFAKQPTGIIKGYVRDTNRQAIPKANIQYFSSGEIKGEVIADRAGNFEISGLPLGTYVISVSKKGYLPRKEMPVAVLQNETVILVRMEKKPHLWERLLKRKKQHPRVPCIGIELPPPVTLSPRAPKRLILGIANPDGSERYGTMSFNISLFLGRDAGELVTMEELPHRFEILREYCRLRPSKYKNMLVIQSQRDVPHGQVVAVVDAAKQVGIDTIGFAMVAREQAEMQSPPKALIPEEKPKAPEELNFQEAQVTEEAEVEPVEPPPIPTGTIIGTVTTLDEEPIPQVEIRYCGPGDVENTVETDEAGNYEIIGAKFGQYVLKARKEGFQNKKLTAILYIGTYRIRNIQMLKKGEKPPKIRTLSPPFAVVLPHSKYFEEFQVSRFFAYVSKTGAIAVDDEIMPSLDDLETYLSVNQADIDTLVIKADKEAKHGVVIDVMERAKRRAIAKLAFAVIPIK